MPGREGHVGGTARDNRVFVEGILGRLYVLTARYEREGRHVPKVEDIGQMLTQTDAHGQPLVSGLPGPLEGHIRPTAPVPQEVTEKMEDIWTMGAEPVALLQLATISQFFALGSGLITNTGR